MLVRWQQKIFFMINVIAIDQSVHYLRRIVANCLNVHIKKNNSASIGLPKIIKDSTPFSKLVHSETISFPEYITLLLALVPHIQPDFFSNIIAEYFPEGGDFPAFGGVKGTNHRGILPTGETAQFVLAGNDLAKRLEIQQLFSPEHWFARKSILSLEPVREGEPAMSGRLMLDDEWVELITTGRVAPPRFSSRFPAEHLTTALEWDDLVLPPSTLNQIREIETWVRHHYTLLHEWGMSRTLKPGYRALFYGPPGTGKTLTASLLGKLTNRQVFRIDLSLVVSKFIGETEKNLATLFNKAESKDWILFFDEADALFGKRTDVRDAHDKYANQEVSFLLQRIESYAGLVILASNFKSNIDDAFMRRFQSVIYYPLPKPNERLLLWQKAFPMNKIDMTAVDFTGIAQRYELSGSSIMNIVQYCCLQTIDQQGKAITDKDIENAIHKEFQKEGKPIR